LVNSFSKIARTKGVHLGSGTFGFFFSSQISRICLVPGVRMGALCCGRWKIDIDCDPEDWKVSMEFKVPAHEGPVFIPPYIFFTTHPSTYKRPDAEIHRIDLRDGKSSVFRSKDVANMPNGMIGCGRVNGLDSFYTCEQGHKGTPARITRTCLSNDGQPIYDVMFEESEDFPLNSPNDICVAKDGAIWFTDPSYGSLQGFRPNPPKAPNAIYRYDPTTKRLKRVLNLGFDGKEPHTKNKPNGICLSPDGRYLYYTNTSAAYPGEEFCECRHRSIWRAQLNQQRDDLISHSLEMVCEVNPPDPRLPAIPDGLKFLGNHLLTSCGQTLVFINPNTCQVVKRIPLDCEEVTNFVVSPDGDKLAVVGNDKLQP